MNEAEIFWNQLFRDKPIAEDRLKSIKSNVMRHILEHPLDFQGEILLKTRKQWGIVLLGLLTISGFVSVLIIYLKGYFLAGLLEKFVWLISDFLPGSLISYLWENIGSKIILIKDIKLVIEILWYDYSWYIVSVLVLLVVMYGSESKTCEWHKNN